MTDLMVKMSTREIAELTDENHRGILCGVRTLVNQGAITERNFGDSEYKDASVDILPRLKRVGFWVQTETAC